MSLPQVELDDRRFQDLVNEARTRIARACPEWTEHNVSDPGITLIELFAWMTDMLVYRLNRVPDKVHVALLELLGITLAPPAPAATDVRFRLAAPAVEPVPVPAWDTEVGTARTARDESIVFQTSTDFTIPALRPTAYLIEHDAVPREIPIGSGVARPRGGDQAPFAAPPVPGDALYLGFDEPLSRLVIAVQVECSQARGAGVDPEDPPLRWEYSTGEGALGWREATLLADHTGGFNYGSGTVELELPAATGTATVGDRKAHWIRCRVDPFTRAEIPARLHAAARDLLDHGRGAGRAHPRDARHPAAGRADRRERRHGRPDLPAALRPGARPHRRRDARGAAAPVGHLGAVGAGRELRRELRRRSPLPARRGGRRGAPGHGGERRRRLVAPVRPGAAEGLVAAHVRLPQRRRPPGQPGGGHAARAQVGDPRGGRGDQPGRGHGRRRRRDARRCPPARAARAAHALPGRHRRRLRGPGRRGLAPGGAGVLHPTRRRRCPGAGAAPADGRGLGAQAQPRGAHSERRAPGPGRGASRPPPDGRHPRPHRARAAARRERRLRRAGGHRRRPGPRRGRDRAHALHLPEPPGRRQSARPRQRLGVRAGAQPGRALRRRPPGAGSRVRQDPAGVRDRPRHPEAGSQSRSARTSSSRHTS